MNKLQCKVCGGKLVLNENDIAVCEYCGMEYNTEALQKMMVELSGPIEVQGINSRQRLIEKAEALERIGKIGDALKVYTEISEEYPDEYIGFYKVCKLELEQLGHIDPSCSWRNPIVFAEGLIKTLKILNSAKAEEMEQLLAHKLDELIEYDHEFDCTYFNSNLMMIVEDGGYSGDSRLNSWSEEKSSRINSVFQDMISGFDLSERYGSSIAWAYGNRAIVNKGGHCFHIILNCYLKDNEDAFLRELVAHQYVATTADENCDLIPPFTWAGWEEKKRQREIENQRRAMQIQEEQRRKEKAQRQQWIRGGCCAYCGGNFESVKVGLFAKELRCENCHRQKDY